MSDRLNYNTLAPAAVKALEGVHVYLHSQADRPNKIQFDLRKAARPGPERDTHPIPLRVFR